jgi:hypothetical protein
MLIPSRSAAALAPVVIAFEQLEVPYYIGGSLASSAYGVPRSTLDVDLVADLKPSHVPVLVAALRGGYYVDGGMISEAIARHSCFNVIHHATSFKVDVFVPKTRAYDRAVWQRVRLEAAELELRPRQITLRFASPEDVILAKLEWYRLGEEVSEQQWRDVRGVLKVQEGALDWEYMTRWAAELGVADLLERARQEAYAS